MMISNTITEADVYGAINRAVRAAGSASAFARQCGVSRAFLCHVLSGLTRPSDRVLAGAGLRRVVSVHYEFAEGVHV